MELKKDKLEDEVDLLFKDRPVELKHIKDNKEFIKDIEEHPLPSEHSKVNVFGTSVDLNSILKDNIWNRSIYTVDMLCDEHLHMNIEKMKKYMAKKRKVPSNIIWLMLLLMGVGVAIIVILLVIKSGGIPMPF